MDPCSPIERPWPTASVHYTALDDGLTHPWDGLAYVNPPYSNAGPWMARLAAHGHGVGLVFARTDTRWWFEHVWPHATALLFLAGRVTFRRPDGTEPGHSSGGPSVLVAYGAEAAERLAGCGLAGALTGQVKMLTPFGGARRS